ncbi:hypothetical protein D7W82_23490 [Corallococcus sp. CA049B]|nr:hypothetical protein D7W82_23490 [Corallococcus sp. CA049B]
MLAAAPWRLQLSPVPKPQVSCPFAQRATHSCPSPFGSQGRPLHSLSPQVPMGPLPLHMDVEISPSAALVQDVLLMLA